MFTQNEKKNTKISPRNLFFPWLFALSNFWAMLTSIIYVSPSSKRSFNRRARIYIRVSICMCRCSYVFIGIHIYLSLSVSFYIYIHICLNLKKKETKIRTAVTANMKSKLMGKIFLYFNSCQIGGKMHLQIIGWQFLFKFLLQGQLFLLTSFWMLGFIYAAQHSMMNAKVKCLGEINCQTEFRHYSFYDVKKVRTVTPRHL